MSRTTITRINNRHDTAENWEAKNPILGVGEIGYDVTNQNIKIGDGETAWKNLNSIKKAHCFENLAWSKIAEISEAGEARDYFNIGDTKTIELSTGEEIEVRIIGFNHDDIVNGNSQAGITVEMVDILQDKYKYNNSSSATGGWDKCTLRTSTLPTIFNQLPSDLQEVIKTVLKKTNNGGTTITYSEDQLFILSLCEMYSAGAMNNIGDTSSSNNVYVNKSYYCKEGKQYEYYANQNGDNSPYEPNRAISKTGVRWLRSSIINISNGTWTLVEYGSSNGDGNGARLPEEYYGANVAHGVSFGFCV